MSLLRRHRSEDAAPADGPPTDASARHHRERLSRSERRERQARAAAEADLAARVARARRRLAQAGGLPDPGPPTGS